MYRTTWPSTPKASPCLQVDLLPSEQAIKSVESDIHAHNSEVSIMRTTHCSLDIAQILNKGAFAGSRQTPSKLQQLQNLDASRSSVQQQSADALAATAAATYTQSTVTDDNHTEADAAMHSRSDSHSTHYPGPQSQHDDVQVRSQEAQAASSHQHSSDTGHDRSHSHSHDHSHDHAGHLKSVRSISLVQQGAVDLFRYTCAGLELVNSVQGCDAGDFGDSLPELIRVN